MWRNFLRIFTTTCIATTVACTGIDKVFSPTQGSPMVEPSFTPLTGPLPTNTPELANVTSEITLTPNSLQNVEINTEEGPASPIVSQEYLDLDQKSLFATNNQIEKFYPSFQSHVEKTTPGSTIKAWGILSTDQSGHKYVTPIFEILDGEGNPISEYLLLSTPEEGAKMIFDIIPLNLQDVTAPNGKQYAALMTSYNPVTNSYISPKPYAWTPYSLWQISVMTPEDQAKVPVYFSAFGQIDDVSSQQEAPNGAELRKVLIPALTTAVVPIITPENISPESKTIINELKNYVLPKTGKDSGVGPGIMMRIINSINKGEIVSLEGLRELVNSTGKPIIADGRVLSKYPSFCVSEEQNKIFSQQGVSLIISTNDVNLTTINTSEVASDNEFIFGKTLGETVNPFINFTSESITQGLVRPGCNGYLMPTSDDMGILVTPDDYTSEELSAEVAQEAPDMASNAITTNNYSYLAVIGHAGVIDLFAK